MLCDIEYKLFYLHISTIDTLIEWLQGMIHFTKLYFFFQHIFWCLFMCILWYKEETSTSSLWHHIKKRQRNTFMLEFDALHQILNKNVIPELSYNLF